MTEINKKNRVKNEIRVSPGEPEFFICKNVKEKTCKNADNRFYTERRTKYFCKNYLHMIFCNYFTQIVIVFLSLLSTCKGNCDFKGSGLDLDGKGVQTVYLSCTSGHIQWRYPRAALKIILQLPLDDREFHGCIKVTHEFEGARLFIEGHRSLIPLFSRGDGIPEERLRCFDSYRGKVALFLEAEPSLNFRDLTATFDYDLQPLGKGELYDPMQDCRPCTDAELVHWYCTADFAARGNILSSADDSKLQMTKLTISASKIFQQNIPIFSKEIRLNKRNSKHFDRHSRIKSISGSNRGNKKISSVELSKEASFSALTNEILNGNEFTEKSINFKNKTELNFRKSLDVVSNDPRPAPRFLGDVYMPLECGATSGEGEFVLIGALRFGQPILKCAAMVKQWQIIVASFRDRTHCVLEA